MCQCSAVTSPLSPRSWWLGCFCHLGCVCHTVSRQGRELWRKASHGDKPHGGYEGQVQKGICCPGWAFSAPSCCRQGHCVLKVPWARLSLPSQWSCCDSQWSIPWVLQGEQVPSQHPACTPSALSILAGLGVPCHPQDVAPGAAAMGCWGSHTPVVPRAGTTMCCEWVSQLAPQRWAPKTPQRPPFPSWGAWTLILRAGSTPEHGQSRHPAPGTASASLASAFY